MSDGAHLPSQTMPQYERVVIVSDDDGGGDSDGEARGSSLIRADASSRRKPQRAAAVEKDPIFAEKWPTGSEAAFALQGLSVRVGVLAESMFSPGLALCASTMPSRYSSRLLCCGIAVPQCGIAAPTSPPPCTLSSINET